MPYLNNFQKVLDIGCNHGLLFNYIRKLDLIYGFDKLEFIGYDKFKYKEYDFPFYTDLKNIEGKFDVITMLEVAEHLTMKEFEYYLDWIKQHLSKKGVLIITTLNIKNPFVIFWQNRNHIKPYSLESLKDLLKIKGFGIIESEKKFITKNPFKLLFCLLTQSDYHSIIFMVAK